MKNLKKIFAIALSVATVAMSTSAFAATYDAEATSVALTTEEIATLDSYAGQMTVVVVPKTFGESSTAADIYYINQDDAAAFAAIIADMGVKAALDDTKEWEVRIGGENVAEVVTFDVVFEEEGPVVRYGDANADGAIELKDATLVLQYVAEWASAVEAIDAKGGDANRDGAIELKDATLILQYVAEWQSAKDIIDAE